MMNKVKTLRVVGMALAVIILVSVGAQAEAFRFGVFGDGESGHKVAVYEGEDIWPELRPYLRKVVFDLKPFNYTEPGVKVDFTWKARILPVVDRYKLIVISYETAKFITSKDQWHASGSDRGSHAVFLEILGHLSTFANKDSEYDVYIEYFKKDTYRGFGLF